MYAYIPPRELNNVGDREDSRLTKRNPMLRSHHRTKFLSSRSSNTTVDIILRQSVIARIYIFIQLVSRTNSDLLALWSMRNKSECVVSSGGIRGGQKQESW
jgi:hypothetical protein